MISSDWPAEYLGPLTAVVLPESCACPFVCECMTMLKALKGNVRRHIAVICGELDKKSVRQNAEKRDFIFNER